MPDVQDLNKFFGRTVNDNVRRADELTGSVYFSRSSEARKRCQLLNTFNNLLCDTAGRRGVLMLDALNRGLQLISRLCGPPDHAHE